MNNDFYVGNRKNLSKKLGGGLVVVSAYAEMQRKADMAFQFEQEANFWYLTGIEATRWQVIHDGTRDYTWLVRPGLSEQEQIFDGSVSDEAALKVSGADKVIASDECETLLRSLTRKHSTVYTLAPTKRDAYSFSLNPAKKQTHDMLERVFSSVQDCQGALESMRAIKQDVEVAALQKAINLTIAAFSEVRKNIASYHYEYQIDAAMTAHFRSHNAIHGYDPIVAGGQNACTLHYVRNGDALRKKDVVLLDVGAQVAGYNADISRSYAIGKPTQRQVAVHAALQAAQKAIIDLLRPSLSVAEYQQRVDEIMYDALQSLGLSSSDKQATVRRYMPHAVSHGLGIDVHDSLGRPRIFQPGMVLTVEPGIYIPEEGLGLRLEDDILITKTGHRNLSRKLSTDL